VPATAARLRQSLEQYADRVADEWAELLTEAVRPEAPKATPTGDPRQRPPGTLQRAIRHGPVQRLGTSRRFKLEAPGIEAATTDKGARPHVIRPRGGGVLTFHSDGAVRFAKVVQHPGNVGTGWWAKAIQKHGPATLRQAGRRVRL
jgi:hypothetical protein